MKRVILSTIFILSFIIGYSIGIQNRIEIIRNNDNKTEWNDKETDSVNSGIEKHPIYLQSDCYYQNYEKHKKGFLNKFLIAELRKDSATFLTLEKYEKLKITGFVFTTRGIIITAMISSLILYAPILILVYPLDIAYFYYFSYIPIGVIKQKRANNLLRKAIIIYNTNSKKY